MLNLKSMKKTGSVIALGVALGIAANAVNPPEAHALIGVCGLSTAGACTTMGWVMVGEISTGVFFGALSGDGPQGEKVQNFFLALFASLLILDQNIPSVPALTSQDLLDNGYSPAQVDLILSDAARLNEKMAAENKVIGLSKDATLGTVQSALRAIMPQASPEFVDVFSNRLFLSAQAQQ